MASLGDCDGDGIGDLIPCGEPGTGDAGGPEGDGRLEVVSGRDGKRMDVPWSPLRLKGFESVHGVEIGGERGLVLVRRLDSDSPVRRQVLVGWTSRGNGDQAMQHQADEG